MAAPSYLLSYPRSGNTFIRYCVEYISLRPTQGVDVGVHGWAVAKYGVGLKNVNIGMPPILKKKHNINSNDDRNRKMVCIVRNYKEAIVRHRQYVNVTAGPVDFEMYINILRVFDSWKKDQRLLVYYEDLIKLPIKTMRSICEFIEINTDRFDLFVDNFETIRKNAVISYCKGRGDPKSYTQGKHEFYHIQHLDDQQRKNWDNYFKDNHKDLFDKYLTRYQENG